MDTNEVIITILLPKRLSATCQISIWADLFIGFYQNAVTVGGEYQWKGPLWNSDDYFILFLNSIQSILFGDFNPKNVW